MLTLAGWMKSSFSRDKGCVSSTCSTALFCTPPTDPCHEIPPVNLSSTTCNVVCPHLSHFEYTKQLHDLYTVLFWFFILIRRAQLLNVAFELDTFSLSYTFFSCSLCWYCFVYKPTPLRLIHVNGRCYDWLTYLNVRCVAVHQWLNINSHFWLYDYHFGVTNVT